MSTYVDEQVRAICLAIANLYHNSSRNPQEAAQFVCSQISVMPTLFRLGFTFLTIFFCTIPVFVYGRTFRALPPEKQVGLFLKCKSARVVLLYDYVKAIESLFIFALYSQSNLMGSNHGATKG